jgi:ethanolamine-phosphate cytidylyltransferase
MEDLLSDLFRSSVPNIVVTCVIGAVVLLLLVSFSVWRGLSGKRRKPVRVYMDGCFDMMHYGHCNALRQARALGDELVVGVVSDEEIIANKGPPVIPLYERFRLYSSILCQSYLI